MTVSGCANNSTNVNTGNSVADNRTTKEAWSDNNIEFEAAALSNKPPFQGQVRVAANSFRGKVVLIGQAKTQELSEQIANRVEQVKGVNTVFNQIRVQEPIGITQITRDSWITTKVKSALFNRDDLKGAKVKVITENGEVFLFGYLTPEHANIATEAARNVDGVKHVIRAFEVATLTVTPQETTQIDNQTIATAERIVEPATVRDVNENLNVDEDNVIFSNEVILDSPPTSIEETSIQ
jgi:osmotically-inducible protein OsmY